MNNTSDTVFNVYTSGNAGYNDGTGQVRNLVSGHRTDYVIRFTISNIEFVSH